MYKITILLLFSTIQVFAQNYVLNLNLKDGSSATISVDDIRKIIFESETGINSGSDKTQVIESFKIFQNYPNPFNPSTTITYQIPNYSNVRVNIYDLNGQLIKELLNENQSAGEYRIMWDGTNQSNLKVASGVYIYSVRCNESLLSKQMILLK